MRDHVTPRVRPRGALTVTVSHAHSKVGGGCGYSWPRAEACPQNDTLKSQSPAPVNEALFGNRVLAEVTTLDAAITHETGVRAERGDLGSGGAEGWPGHVVLGGRGHSPGALAGSGKGRPLAGSGSRPPPATRCHVTRCVSTVLSPRAVALCYTCPGRSHTPTSALPKFPLGESREA